MTISEQIEMLLEQLPEQYNLLQFGNIDFIIQKGIVSRVDIRNCVKLDSIPPQTIPTCLKK